MAFEAATALAIGFACFTVWQSGRDENLHRSAFMAGAGEDYACHFCAAMIQVGKVYEILPDILLLYGGDGDMRVLDGRQ